MGTELRTLIRDRIRHPSKEKPLDAAFHNAVAAALDRSGGRFPLSDKAYAKGD
jgi:hypothetical protein